MRIFTGARQDIKQVILKNDHLYLLIKKQSYHRRFLISHQKVKWQAALFVSEIHKICSHIHLKREHNQLYFNCHVELYKLPMKIKRIGHVAFPYHSAIL